MESLISPEFFDSISEFFITKPSLCGRLVSMFINEKNIWVMGVPMSLTHTKYPRNALLFNLAFVVDNGYPRLREFFPSIEQALMKLSHYLTTLERESEYLFRHGNFDGNQTLNTTTIQPSSSSNSLATQMKGITMSLPSSSNNIPVERPPLSKIMIEIFDSINSQLSATVNVDRGNTIYLKLYPVRTEPIEVLLHQVPVPVVSTNFTAEALQGILSMWSSVSPSTRNDLNGYKNGSKDDMKKDDVKKGSNNGSKDDMKKDSNSNQPNSNEHNSNEPENLTLDTIHAQDEESAWDLGLKQIIPFIDSVSHVKKISMDAGMDISAVCKALQHLLYYNVIQMVDIFQYRNIYTTLPAIRNLYTNNELRKNCVMSVTLDTSKPPPEFHQVFSIYCQLQPDTTVKQIMLNNACTDLNIDIRRLITFGLLNGLLRRIHKYPVSISVSPNTTSTIPNLHQMIDGKHSYDEIAVALGIGHTELDKHFDQFLYK